MSNPGSSRILVVDDEVRQMQALCDTLSAIGFEVSGCASGQEALEVLRTESFDLVLTDLMMPGMDGIALLQLALKEDPNLVGVVMTGEGTIATAVGAMQAGALDYILKPFRIRYALPVILRSLEVRRLRLENAELLGQAQSGLVRAKEIAEQANLAKSEFLSRMSHELRTPLNAIIGFAQILELEGHSESVGQAVHHILSGGRHLLSMINEILDLSRIETSDLSISIEPVELGPVMHEVAGLVAPLAEPSKVTVRLDAPDQGGLFVRADPQRLKQICINLLSNAIKYNVAGGSVTVSWRVCDGQVSIVVADTGRGIPIERARELFSPFSRLGAEHLAIEGTGLGLALSRGLAQYMLGTLRYEPNEPRGSVFVLELQAATGQATAQTKHPADAPFAFRPRSGKTILLIEDNSSNVALIERVLKDCGNIEFLVASTGYEGIEMARAEAPDLVLLDVNLPDISGYEVLRAFRDSPDLRALKVVVTSADATKEQIKRMLGAGALEYLTKPLDVARLYAVLNDLLGDEERAA